MTQSLLPDPQPGRGRYAKGVVVTRLNTSRRFLAAAWDAYRTARHGEAGLSRRQQDRLRDLVAYARTHSAYFADLYRDVPGALTDVTQLPVVTKAEMMRHFDQWVTDPSVNLEQVEAFVADPALIGHDYLNRYVVCTTSGSTGTPAILLHDRGALVIYNVLGYVRALPVAMFSARNLWALVRGRSRLAAVFVTGGHFLGNTMMARRLRTVPYSENGGVNDIHNQPVSRKAVSDTENGDDMDTSCVQ